MASGRTMCPRCSGTNVRPVVGPNGPSGDWGCFDCGHWFLPAAQAAIPLPPPCPKCNSAANVVPHSTGFGSWACAGCLHIFGGSPPPPASPGILAPALICPGCGSNGCIVARTDMQGNFLRWDCKLCGRSGSSLQQVVPNPPGVSAYAAAVQGLGAGVSVVTYGVRVAPAAPAHTCANCVFWGGTNSSFMAACSHPENEGTRPAFDATCGHWAVGKRDQ